MIDRTIGSAVEMQRHVNAPPEVVFGYFTDASLHQSWLGSAAEIDPRPGGIYRVKVAPGVELRGEFLEVEPPSRVVYTWGWSSPVPLPGDVHEIGPGSTVVEIHLSVDGDGTMLRVVHRGIERSDHIASHKVGWDYSLSRLLARIQGSDPGPFDATAPLRSG